MAGTMRALRTGATRLAGVPGGAWRRGLGRVLGGALLVGLLAACQPVYRNHGWAPKDADLAEISVGRDTRDSVREKIGEPSTSGVLTDSGWYYVESRWEHYGARAPREIDRQVVAVTFSTRGTVENVERFGLEHGQVVALSRRVSESGIKGVPFLRQLFSSFGRLSAGQLLD